MFAILFQTADVCTRLGDSLLILYVRTIVAAIGWSSAILSSFEMIEVWSPVARTEHLFHQTLAWECRGTSWWLPWQSLTEMRRHKKGIKRLEVMKKRVYFVEFSRSWRALLCWDRGFTKCGKFSLKLEHLSTMGLMEIEAATFHM